MNNFALSEKRARTPASMAFTRMFNEMKGIPQGKAAEPAPGVQPSPASAPQYLSESEIGEFQAKFGKVLERNSSNLEVVEAWLKKYNSIAPGHKELMDDLLASFKKAALLLRKLGAS
jgi:hypothetical protein